jgi:uncharacterized protein YjbJ (UPF0337 family)
MRSEHKREKIPRAPGRSGPEEPAGAEKLPAIRQESEAERRERLQKRGLIEDDIEDDLAIRAAQAVSIGPEQTSQEKTMDKDRIKGKMEDIEGKAKRQAGELTHDKEAQAEGAAEQIKGKAQHAFGKAKDAGREAMEHGKQKIHEQTKAYQNVRPKKPAA